MDASIIAGISSSLSSAATMSKALLGMKIDAEVRDAVIAIQSELMAAQSAALQSYEERDRLYKRIRELETILERKSKWDEVSNLFKPFVTDLALAYSSDDERFQGLYCPKCFENERLSRLQEEKGSLGGHYAQCLQCDTKLKFKRPPPTSSVVGYF